MVAVVPFLYRDVYVVSTYARRHEKAGDNRARKSVEQYKAFMQQLCMVCNIFAHNCLGRKQCGLARNFHRMLPWLADHPKGVKFCEEANKEEIAHSREKMTYICRSGCRRLDRST